MIYAMNEFIRSRFDSTSSNKMWALKASVNLLIKAYTKNVKTAYQSEFRYLLFQKEKNQKQQRILNFKNSLSISFGYCKKVSGTTVFGVLQQNGTFTSKLYTMRG